MCSKYWNSYCKDVSRWTAVIAKLLLSQTCLLIKLKFFFHKHTIQFCLLLASDLGLSVKRRHMDLEAVVRTHCKMEFYIQSFYLVWIFIHFPIPYFILASTAMLSFTSPRLWNLSTSSSSKSSSTTHVCLHRLANIKWIAYSDFLSKVHKLSGGRPCNFVRICTVIPHERQDVRVEADGFGVRFSVRRFRIQTTRIATWADKMYTEDDISSLFITAWVTLSLEAPSSGPPFQA